MKKYSIWLLCLTLLICSASSSEVWAADSTNAYLGELRDVLYAENVFNYQMDSVKIKTGKFSLTGMGIDTTLQANKAPAPLRPSVDFEKEQPCTSN